jgi:splicing factor U2AF subunit
MTDTELQQDFDLFYEDIFMELAKYGEIEEMNVCDNVGDHLVGSNYILILDVYVRFKYEEDAGKACDSLNDRFYAGKAFVRFAGNIRILHFRSSIIR